MALSSDDLPTPLCPEKTRLRDSFSSRCKTSMPWPVAALVRSVGTPSWL